MSRIFISHSSKDYEPARAVAHWLKEEGHTSYFLDFDPDLGIAAGKQWEDELYRHLRLCRVVIALVSPNWLASRWCFAEVTQARAAGKPVFVVKIAPCAIDSVLTDVHCVDLMTDQTEGYRRLSRGLKEVGIDPIEAFTWNPSRPPYPGLLAFEDEDAAIFFGRDADIQKGLEMLDGLRRRNGPPFVLCLGSSGSGKSSLLRAGLIPRLRKNPANWLPVAPCRPQENPMEELALKLTNAFDMLGESRPWRSVYEQLFAPSTSHDWEANHDHDAVTGAGLLELALDLRVVAKQHDATVLLSIDQTEELFGYSNAHLSRVFLQCLRGALEASGHGLMVVATMRSDTLSSFQMHPGLQGFAYEPLPVDPIPLQDLPQIIEGPAHLADVTLEPGLVQMLMHDATTSDALPLLAFTLRELYERYGRDSRLSVRDYEDLGRLEGSVRRAADSVIERISPTPEELGALRVAFVPAMVRVNDEGDFVRRRAVWLDLPARAHRSLQEFVEARLLVSRGEGGERVVEVAHEALLRAWPRLTDWLREDRDNLRVFDDFRRAAEAWHTHGSGEDWLVHHGERLEAAERTLELARFAGQVSDIAKGYLAKCMGKRREEKERAERQARAEHERLEAEARSARRTRIAAFVISVVAMIAVGAAILAWRQTGVAAVEQKQALLSRSKALSYASIDRTEKGNATLGSLLALEALPKQADTNLSSMPSTEAALVYALFAQREKHILTGHTDGINKAHFSSDGSRVVTASRDHTARIWSSTGKLTATLTGHSGQVYSAEFSPDGKRIVTASSDKTARIWDAEIGKAIAVLGSHQGDVYHASFSPDGKRVVTASADKTARVWDVETGKMMAILSGHQDEIFWAEFSPDSSRVITASKDKTARVWDADTAKTIFLLTDHDDIVLKAKFSSDGRRLVTASWDRTARLWDAANGNLIVKLTGHKEGISNAAFSADNKLIVTTSADSTVRLWDGASGIPVAVLVGHKGQVHDAQFSPDGRWLLTAADDGTARLWDVATREALDVFAGHTSRVWSARFSPDGQRVVTASEDNTARVWEVAHSDPKAELKGHSNRVHRAVFSPDGHRLITVSDDYTARIWDSQSGDSIAALTGHTGALWYAAFSKDSQHFATTSTDGTVRLWETATGRLLHTLRGHAGLVYHAHFSPSGQQIVTGANDGTARVWDTASGKTLKLLGGHQGAVNFVEFSPDGQRILTTSQDKTARLWNAATAELIAVLEGHQGPIVNGAFSADGTRLVTASWDKTARLWDAISGNALKTLEGHSDAVLSAVFSPDGKLIVTASSDNAARIWDAMNAKPLHVLLDHGGEVNEASFSPDGRLVLTASADGTARLWHAASGLLVAVFKGHRDSVASAAFAPSGRQVATASWDHTARLWRLKIGPGDDWIKRAEENLPRQLSDNERERYLGN